LNGDWHDASVEDMCYCIYTFRFHREVELAAGRKPLFVKVGTSGYS